MKRFSLLSMGLFALAFVGGMVAQTPPLLNEVTVHFDQPVHVQDKVLPPGQYTIQQQSHPTGAPGLIIEGQNQSIVTPASTMEAVKKPAATETKVVLREFEGNRYLEQIWVEGQRFGWQVPLADNVKDNQQTKSMDVRATAGKGGQSSGQAETQQPMSNPQSASDAQ